MDTPDIQVVGDFAVHLLHIRILLDFWKGTMSSRFGNTVACTHFFKVFISLLAFRVRIFKNIRYSKISIASYHNPQKNCLLLWWN